MDSKLLDLPEEVIFDILGYLTVQEVIQFSLVCKFCNEITKDSEIWKDFVSTIDPNKCSYLEQTGILVKNWKRFYSKLKEQDNWQMKHIASKILSGHKGPINCIDFNKDFVLSGSSDSTIRVWDLRNGISNATLKNTLKGHADAVKCLQFDNDKIISGSTDLSVKLWKLREGSVSLLYNHGGGVLCLNYDKTHLASGSRDQTVRFFDLASKQLLQRYMADSYVYAVQLHENTIDSSGNGFIHFRDRRTGLTAETIKLSQKLPILSFKHKANNVVFSTEKGVIYLYDIRKATKPVIETVWFNYRTLLNEAHIDYLASYNKIVATFGPYLSVLSAEGNAFKKQFTIREFYGNSFSGVKANYNTIVAGGNDYNIMVLNFAKKTGFSEIPLVDVQ